MKVTNNKTNLKRHYYISVLIFLLSLGMVPVSLISSGVFAETGQEVENDSKSKSVISKPLEVKLDEGNLGLGTWGLQVNKTAETVKTEAKDEAETKIAEASEDSEVSMAAEVVEAEPVAYVETAYVETTYTETYASNVETYTEPVYTEPVQTYYDQINIAGNTIPIFYSDNTLIDAGSQVGLYGNHFLYGHNTANVFGGLSSLGIGARFTVTLGGVIKTYQVVGSDLQTKSHFEGMTTHIERQPGITIKTNMRVMKAITAYGEYNGNYYDYILMTCAGTSYGNGDASHRLVLFANEI